MDALQEAKRYIDGYETHVERLRNHSDRLTPSAETYPHVAAVYAAIAQAEQLKRIADAMETIVKLATEDDQ